LSSDALNNDLAIHLNVPEVSAPSITPDLIMVYFEVIERPPKPHLHTARRSPGCAPLLTKALN
jgi:hypothetical protein